MHLASTVGPTLLEFIVAHRGDILARSRQRLIRGDVSTSREPEASNGLSDFLDQLIAILPATRSDDQRTAEEQDFAATAMLHGGDLLRRGLTVADVVQDYGSVCQSIMELAGERAMTIAAPDLHKLNQCLDEAIADAVTAYEHQRDRTHDSGEMRDSTGSLLGRSLERMRALIDRTLTDVRRAGRIQIDVGDKLGPDRVIPLVASPRPSVLIVDDDEDILTSLADLLSSRYRLTLARDGGEALRVLEGARFDMAIVDLQLPTVDGLALVKTVRSADLYRAPPFLFLSGESSPQVKAQALALGAVDYMTKPFDSDELVARIARILATVAREASLLAAAMTDSLTGLANYRGFTQSLDRELERSRRYGLPLSLITLDLDHLKVINDRHGHDAGDAAVRLVAQVLAAAVRRFELVARQGGDEFAVILPNTGAPAARQLAERLRDAVGKQTIRGLKLSASIGLACWENSGQNGPVGVAALLKASDEALYRAKRAGRDRIESQTL